MAGDTTMEQRLRDLEDRTLKIETILPIEFAGINSKLDQILGGNLPKCIEMRDQIQKVELAAERNRADSKKEIEILAKSVDLKADSKDLENIKDGLENKVDKVNIESLVKQTAFQWGIIGLILAGMIGAFIKHILG